MIYSTKCIDESQGFDLQKDGSLKPRKLGRMVLTAEECKEIMERDIREEVWKE